MTKTYSVPFSHLHFPSVEEFVSYATTTKKYRTRHQDTTFNFTGTHKFQDAVNLAARGWAEGTKKIGTRTQALLDKVTSLIEVPQIRYDVTGTDFDMGLHMAGVPEEWSRLEYETREGQGFKQVKIVANISVSAGIDKSVIEARGIALAGLIQALELSGTRVELTAVSPWADIYSHSHTHTDTPKITISVLLKAADQPLDLDRLAFCLIHPSMTRRLVFAVLETFPHWYEDMGYPTEALPAYQGDLYMSKALLGEVQWTNVSAAQTWLIEQLKTQGVHLTTEDK